MKTNFTLFFLIYIVFLLSISCNENNYKENKYSKIVYQRTFHAVKDFDTIKIGELYTDIFDKEYLDSDGHMNLYYNTLGYRVKIEKLLTRDTSNIYEIIEYEIDTNGRIQKEIKLTNPKTTYCDTISTDYLWKNDFLTEKITYKNGEVEEKVVFRKDSINSFSEVIYYKQQGIYKHEKKFKTYSTLTEWIFENDQKFLKLKDSLYYNSDSTLLVVESSRYGENNGISEKLTYFYEYNEKGKWISQIIVGISFYDLIVPKNLPEKSNNQRLIYITLFYEYDSLQNDTKVIQPPYKDVNELNQYSKYVEQSIKKYKQYRSKYPKAKDDLFNNGESIYRMLYSMTKEYKYIYNSDNKYIQKTLYFNGEPRYVVVRTITKPSAISHKNTSSNIYSVILIVVLLGVVIFLFVFVKNMNEGTEDFKGEDEYWRYVAKSNTKKLYLEYLSKYPKGKYVGLAKTKIKELEEKESKQDDINEDFQNAHSKNTIPNQQNPEFTPPTFRDEILYPENSGNSTTEPQGNSNDNREKDFRNAKRENTIDSLRNFINKWKTGEYIYAAEQLLKKLEEEYAEDEYWKYVTKSNTKKLYLEYLSKYPKGRYVGLAKTKIKELEEKKPKQNDINKDFLNAQSKNSIQGWQEFIDKYKTGELVDSAKIALKEIKERTADFELAKKTNTIDSLRNFISKWKTGKFIYVAEQLLKKLEEQYVEDDYWRYVTISNTKKLYLEYLSKYPHGRYVRIAKAKIKEFEEKEPKPPTKEQNKFHVNYSISNKYTQPKEWSYPVVLSPKKNCIVRSHRYGSVKRRGFKEESFQKSIEKYFGIHFEISGDIRLNTSKDSRPFEPDIAIIDKKTSLNLRIDIEIDEPYAGVSRKPIHLINEDYLRDLYFAERGWIVIRFTEYQVHTNENACLKFIADLLETLYPSLSISSKINCKEQIKVEKQWDLLQAQKWEKARWREQYLNHEFVEQTIPQKPIAYDLNEQELAEENEVTHITIGVKNKPITTRYNDINIFDRDKRIEFYPDGHYYEIDKIPAQSVSTLVSKFFPEFDILYWSRKKAIEKLIFLGIETNELNINKKALEIADEWDKKNKNSRDRGTHLHEQIEKYFANLKYDDSDVFYQFKQFVNEYSDIKPFRTEWKIFDETNLIAGTVDFITKKQNGKYDIYDWKRSKNVINERGNVIIKNKWQKRCLGKLNYIDDTSYYRYSLQQNIYKYILEHKYNMKIDKMYLIVMHTELTKYYKIEAPEMTAEVEYIINNNDKLLQNSPLKETYDTIRNMGFI